MCVSKVLEAESQGRPAKAQALNSELTEILLEELSLEERQDYKDLRTEVSSLSAKKKFMFSGRQQWNAWLPCIRRSNRSRKSCSQLFTKPVLSFVMLQDLFFETDGCCKAEGKENQAEQCLMQDCICVSLLAPATRMEASFFRPLYDLPSWS